MDQELFARFRSAPSRCCPSSEDKVVPEAKFGDDLDADSLDLVELVMALEEEFDIEVPGGGARGHRDRRPGLRPGRRQALTMDGRGRRVAVTGLGVVAPCGIGVEAFWAGLLGPGTHRRASPSSSTDWDPTPWFDNPKEARRADRVEQFALAAAAEALEQAGATVGVDPAASASIFGTGVGGLHTLEEQIDRALEKGERRVSPFLVPMMMANAAGAAVSMRYGLQGPYETIVHRLRRRHPRHRLRRPADRLGPLRRRASPAAPSRPAPPTARGRLHAT